MISTQNNAASDNTSKLITNAACVYLLDNPALGSILWVTSNKYNLHFNSICMPFMFVLLHLHGAGIQLRTSCNLWIILFINA